MTTFFNNPDIFGLSLTVCPSHELKFLNGGAVDWKKIGCYNYTDIEILYLHYHQQRVSESYPYLLYQWQRLDLPVSHLKEMHLLLWRKLIVLAISLEINGLKLCHCHVKVRIYH